MCRTGKFTKENISIFKPGFSEPELMNRVWIFSFFLLAGVQATITPFTINVPDDVLNDLKQKLERTRLPQVISGSKWTEGSDFNVRRLSSRSLPRDVHFH